jgi:tRNA 2-thiouridine synthesizing protein A
MAQQVDARGLSCPQPVILTRQALQQTGDKILTVLVDTMTQVYNCSRAAEKLGWKVEYEQQGDAFELKITK